MVLEDEVEAGAKGRQAHGGTVDSVDQDGPCVWLDDPEESEKEGGFSTACATHNAHLFSRPHFEAHFLENIAKLFPVAGAHIPKLNFSSGEGGKSSD